MLVKEFYFHPFWRGAMLENAAIVAAAEDKEGLAGLLQIYVSRLVRHTPLEENTSENLLEGRTDFILCGSHIQSKKLIIV